MKKMQLLCTVFAMQMLMLTNYANAQDTPCEWQPYTPTVYIDTENLTYLEENYYPELYLFGHTDWIFYIQLQFGGAAIRGITTTKYRMTGNLSIYGNPNHLVAHAEKTLPMSKIPDNGCTI